MSYRTSYGRTVRPLEKSLLSGLEDSSDGSESDESVTAGRTRSKSRVKRTGARPPCPKCFLCGEIVSDLTTHLKEHRDALKIFACHSCHRGFTSPDFYVNHRCRRKSSRKFKSTSVDELQSASHLLMLKCCGKLVCNVENDDLSKLSDLLRSQPDKRQQLQLVKILSASELSSSLQLSVSYISINRSLPASCYFCPTKKFDSCRDLFTHLCETQHLDLLNCVKCGSQQSSVVAYHDHLINQNCTAAPPAEDSVMLDFIRSSFVDGLSTTKSGKSAKDKRKIKSSNNPRISCDLCGKSYKENQWNSHDCAISYTRRLLVDNKVVKCPAVTFTPSKVDCCASGCFEVPQKMLAWLSRNVILPLILTKDVSLCDCPLKKSTENINVRSCGRELKKESDSEPNMLNCPKWRLKKNLTKAEERNEEVEESKEANLSEETASNDSSENFFEKIEAEVKRSLEFLKEKQSDKTGQNPPGKMLNDQKLTEEKSILHEEKQLNVAGKSDFDIVGLTPADSMSETQSQAEAAEHLLAKEKSAENRPVAPLCAKLPIQICEVFSLAPPEEDVDENSPLITDAEMVDTNSELSAVPQLSPPVSAVLVPSLSEIKPTCSYAGAPLPGMESGSYQLTVLPQNLIPSRLQTDFAAVISPSDARIGPHYLISGAGAKEALLSENRWIQTSIDPLVATDGLAALADGCPSHLPCQITSTTCTVCRVEQKSRELLALHMKQKHVLLCGKCTVCFVSESCLTAHREICQKNPVDLIGMMFWCPRCPKSFNDLGHYYIHLIEIHPDKVSFANRTGVVIPECLTSKANAGRPAFWNWSAAQPSPSVHPALCSTSRSSTSDGHVGCDSESPIPKRRRVSEPRPSVISGPSADLSVGSASNLVDYSSNPPPSELESQSYSEVMNSSMDNTNDDSFMTACSSQEANETNINSSLEEIPEVENEPESNSCEKVLTATVKEGPTAVPSPSIDPETDDECAIVEEVPKNEASSRLNNSPLDVITDQTSSKRLTHECYICKKKFLTKLSLTDHIQTHAHDAGNTVEEVLPIPVNQTVYVCRICSIAYSSRDMYQQHFSRHNDFYSCPLCSSIAFSRDQMNQHTKAHAAGLAFGCSICFKAMRSEFSLHMHLGFTHRIAMIWICKSCGYGHRDINVAVGHIQVAHRDQLTGPSDKVTQIRSLLGVCAHRKLHYQPSIDEIVPQLPADQRVVVGECAHRTFNCYNETLIVCSKCGTLLPAGKYLLEDDKLRQTGQIQLQLMDEASDREFSIFPSLQRAPPMLTMRPTAPPPLIPTPRMVPTLQPIGLRMPPRMAIRSTTPPLAPAVAPRALQLAPTVRPAPVQGGRQVREVRSSVNDVVNDVVQRSKGSAEETSALAERLRQPPQLNVIPSSKVAVPSSSVPRPIAPAPLKNSQKRTIGLACDTCGESMTSPAALKVHVLRHFPNAKFLCLECGFHCENSDGLQIHIVENHYDKLKYNLECRKCKSSFPTQALYLSHSHPSEMHRCQRCRLSFFSILAYKNHLNAHGAGGPLACMFCGLCFGVKRSLELHEISEHDTLRWFMCRECGLCFKAVTQLREHFHSKHVTPPKTHREQYWCKICQRLFGQIDEHLRAAHEVTALKPRDPVNFDQQHDSFVGVVADTNVPMCKPSGSASVEPSSLLRHTSVITSKASVKHSVAARQSPVKIASAEDVTWLTQLHPSMELLWICQHCKEVFIKRDMLRLHFGAHQYPGFWLLKVRQEDGSSRLAVCSICDFECFNRQQMFDHLQLKHNHLGCFPCTESDCQETFVYRDDRNYHLHVSHNRECFIATALAAGQKGQRPGDVCLFCALDYKSPSELVKHVVTMHVVGRGNLITDGSVDIWICSTCGLCFNDQTDLGVHVKNHRLQTALRVTSGFKEGLSHFRFVVECEMGKTLEIYCGMCRENLNRGASAVSHFLEKHAGPHRWQIERLHSSTASNPMKLHNRHSCRWCLFGSPSCA